MLWHVLITLAAAGQLRKLARLPVDEPPAELEKFRRALVTTEETMRDAQLATASHDAANRLMQNLIVVAFRQVQSLGETMAQLTPELTACLMEKRPWVNQTNHTLFRILDDDTGNFSAHALRAEMHNIRVQDAHADNLEKEIDACRDSACGEALVQKRGLLRKGKAKKARKGKQMPFGVPAPSFPILPAASPILPLITSELEQVSHQFAQLSDASRAAKASSAVMEGMTAEATKEAFKLQEDVEELHARLAACGRESAPFMFHDEVEMHLGDNPEVAHTMYARAKAEAKTRRGDVADLAAELAACHAGCR